MNEKLKKTKEIYNNIQIPEELDFIIRKTINDEKKILKRRSEMKQRKNLKRGFCSAAAVFTIFFGSINLSSNVAMAMYKVPVLGDFAKLVTFREYKYDSDIIEMNVKVPNIENTGNKELEDRINEEINSRLEKIIAEGEEEAKKYNEQLQENEETKGETRQVAVYADYELKYSNNDILSFIINRELEMSSVDAEVYFYNINLKTGAELKISDVLGENYKSIADESIKKQIKDRMKQDENQIFFGSEEDKELGIDGFTGIDENQTFYINENGNVVIKFEKYVIAPGYMGMPEFEIGPMINIK